MNDALIFLLVLAVLAVLATMALCYVTGFRRGKAVGWCEHHFADIAKENARRAPNGQFRTPTKGTP